MRCVIVVPIDMNKLRRGKVINFRDIYTNLIFLNHCIEKYSGVPVGLYYDNRQRAVIVI